MESTLLEELGLGLVAEKLREAQRDAAALTQAHQRLNAQIAEIDTNLRDDVIEQRERELRDRAQTTAGALLGERKTLGKLRDILLEQDTWADPELILSRARFTRLRGDDRDAEREALATLRASTVLPRMSDAELRLTLHDAIGRSHWAMVAAVSREARYRWRSSNDPAAMAFAQEVSTCVGETFPLRQKASDLFTEARLLLSQVESTFSAIGRTTPRRRQ